MNSQVYFFSFNIDKHSVADYFISLCNELSKNHRVIVITSKIRETNITLSPNITIYKWPSYRPIKWKDFIFLCKKVREHQPQVMISIFSSVNMFLIVGALFNIRQRIAWIRTLSTQFQQNRFKRFRKAIIYKLSTHIIVNSNATKTDAQLVYGINKTKITVLPNSVKDYSYTVPNIPINPSKLIYVGRLHSTKGIDILIKAFAIITDKGYDVHLDIIGNGGNYTQLVDLAKRLNLTDRVFFLGLKNKEEVLKAYKSAYCTIVPSTSEAFGFTVIEAMSVGTCVIGANNTGIKEIIVDNQTGLLFETSNPQDLANKIEMLFENNVFRDTLAHNGYLRFRELYENEFAIDRDLKFFKSITTNEA